MPVPPPSPAHARDDADEADQPQAKRQPTNITVHNYNMSNNRIFIMPGAQNNNPFVQLLMQHATPTPADFVDEEVGEGAGVITEEV